jgi:hypothetical protein
MASIDALPCGSRLNSSAIHVHLFIGVAESFFFPSFHLFLSNPFALTPVNGTVASPAYRISHGSCDHATWSFSGVPRTHAGGPSDIPVSPVQIHRRTHAGLGTGVGNPIALSRRRLAGNGPVDRPQSLSSSHHPF